MEQDEEGCRGHETSFHRQKGDVAVAHEEARGIRPSPTPVDCNEVLGRDTAPMEINEGMSVSLGNGLEQRITRVRGPRRGTGREVHERAHAVMAGQRSTQAAASAATNVPKPAGVVPERQAASRSA